MLTILIAILALFAGVITTRLISKKKFEKKIEKIETAFAAETDSAFSDGFKKGWADGFEYGRRRENLNRITGKPTYGQQ